MNLSEWGECGVLSSPNRISKYAYPYGLSAYGKVSIVGLSECDSRSVPNTSTSRIFYIKIESILRSLLQG